MMKKFHLTSWVITSFIAACLQVFLTATPALGDILDQDSAIIASLSTESRKQLRSPTIGSSRQRDSPVILTQSISSCPCFSLTTLLSTTWIRCIESSGGYPRLLRRHVGDPVTDIWTVQINKLEASCECQSTPSGVCAGKGDRNSDIYHSDMADPEMRACVDILQKVAEEQELSCE